MIDRRSILKLLGGGLAGTLLTPMPYKLLYDAAYWTQNWSWIPRLKYGENAYVPTVSKVCQSGAGLLIRTVDGRPVRAVGNPDNILSQGGMTALAATQTQLACAPSRVKKPLKRSPDGALIETTWEEAMQLLNVKVKGAGKSIAAVTGDSTGSIKDLISALLNKLGSKDFYLMPSEEQVAYKAWKDMGAYDKIGYDTANADFIFSIGANYLENWGPVVYNRKDYDTKRPTNGEKALTLAYAGPAQTNTAACSDFYLPCKPNSEFVVALGVAHLLIKNGASSSVSSFSQFKDLIQVCTPEAVEKLTALPQARLIAAVEALQKAKSPLVIVGGESYGSVGSLAIMAGIACNMLLAGGYSTGNLKSLIVPEGVFAESDSYDTLMEKDFVAFAQAIGEGKKAAPQVLITHEANPVYALPADSGAKALVDKTTYHIALSSFLDETTVEADLVLPITMDFERFDDVYTPYGSGFVNYSAGQPAVPPPYMARAAADILFTLATNLGLSFDIANGAELVAMKAEKVGADMGSLIEGETYVSDETGMASLFFPVDIFAKGMQAKEEAKGDYAIAIQAPTSFGTPTTGIPPFSTKLITNEQLIGTMMVAQVNSATAAKAGVKDGQNVKLSNAFGSVSAKVAIYEGVQNDTFLLPFGLGHTAFDAFSQNKGENVIALTGVSREAGTNIAKFAPIYVSVQKI